MNRTAWLQDRRMEKFCDAWSRWKARELSAQEAGEILGCSERQFRPLPQALRGGRPHRSVRQTIRQGVCLARAHSITAGAIGWPLPGWIRVVLRPRGRFQTGRTTAAGRSQPM
jgi:hypothetical protein